MPPTIEINVVLVRPIYPRNVGYVSRAMANMGAQRLILIDPKCEYDLEARQGAAGAQTHIVEATRYKDIAEFLNREPEGIRVALCARIKKDTDAMSFDDRAVSLVQQQNEGPRPIYLFFGPEDHGLENEDLEYMHFICSLPIFGEFKSINLSHAVMLALYVIRTTETKNAVALDNLNAKSSSKGPGFFFPKLALKEWLTTLGFETGDRRNDAYKVLKRILLNNQASAKELRTLEAIVNQTVRKLGGRPNS